MGACASKFKEFKGDALPPAEEEDAAAAAVSKEVKLVEETVNKDDVAAAVSKEVKLVEETVNKDDVAAAVSKEVKLVEETVNNGDMAAAAAAAEDGGAKFHSLGSLFKEVKSNEGEEGSVESNGKALEEAKQEEAIESTPQENGDVNSREPVADAQAKDESLKSKNLEKNEIKDVKPAIKNVEVEACQKTTREKSAETTKIEILAKYEESKLALDEEKKIIEEKTTEAIKLVSDEEKPTENTKIEEIKDEQVVEVPKNEYRKRASDGEEEKTEN